MYQILSNGGGGRAPRKFKPSDITNQQDLPLFITDTPRFSEKLPRIASGINHCAHFPLFLACTTRMNSTTSPPPPPPQNRTSFRCLWHVHVHCTYRNTWAPGTYRWSINRVIHYITTVDVYIYIYAQIRSNHLNKATPWSLFLEVEWVNNSHVWGNNFLLMHTIADNPYFYPTSNQYILPMKYSCTESEHHAASQWMSFTFVSWQPRSLVPSSLEAGAHLCKGFYLMQNDGLVTKFHQRLGSRESERSQPRSKSSN